jgi:hypothetical protein
MSRYYWDKKETVEDCEVLSLSRLREWGLLSGYAATTVMWTHGLSGRKNSVGLIVDMMENPHIKLKYTITNRDGNKTEYDYQVPLTTTECNFGGIRYWFICPLTGSGGNCGRRIGKLYLPPDGKYFGCRHCYSLSYESRNESRVGRIGQLGYLLKIDRQCEELHKQIKRWHYAGRPTKKARKFHELTNRAEKQAKLTNL